jgi:hypothetical protein
MPEFYGRVRLGGWCAAAHQFRVVADLVLQLATLHGLVLAYMHRGRSVRAENIGGSAAQK